jgi:hypothetical protein
MQHAFGHDITFPWLKVDRFAFEVDDEVTVQHKEELVVIVVLVPVILALHDAQADDGLVDATERLVAPLVGAGIHKRLYVDDGESWELDVEVRRVGTFLALTHRSLRMAWFAIRSLGGRASESPHPDTQTAQNDESQHTWPQRHRITGDEHLRAYQ